MESNLVSFELEGEKRDSNKKRKLQVKRKLLMEKEMQFERNKRNKEKVKTEIKGVDPHLNYCKDLMGIKGKCQEG